MPYAACHMQHAACSVEQGARTAARTWSGADVQGHGQEHVGQGIYGIAQTHRNHGPSRLEKIADTRAHENAKVPAS